jgi:hypothetical protein
MAVEAFTSNQTDGVSRIHAVDRAGKLRYHIAKLTTPTVAGDATSTIDFGTLPAGRVRLLTNDIKVQCSALGASRVLKLGHRAYAGELGVTVAEDDDAFATSVDVAAAGVKAGGLAELTFDMFSRAGVGVFGTVTGGTIPIGAALEVSIPYILE